MSLKTAGLEPQRDLRRELTQIRAQICGAQESLAQCILNGISPPNLDSNPKYITDLSRST